MLLFIFGFLCGMFVICTLNMCKVDVKEEKEKNK